MNIDAHIKITKTAQAPETQKKQAPVTNIQNNGVEEKELAKVNSETFQAYAGIVLEKNDNPKGHIIPREKVLTFFKEQNIPREELYDSLADSISDSDGNIYEKSFKIFKQFLNKNGLVWDIQRIFDRSKEESKINYEVLEFAQDITKPKAKHQMVYKENKILQFLIKLKNNEPYFNLHLVNAFKTHYDKLEKYVEFDPNIIFRVLKNQQNKFCNESILYFLKGLEENKDPREILSEIYCTKDENGDFSLRDAQYISEIRNNFPSQLQSSLSEHIKTLGTNEERKFFLEFAKALKKENKANELFKILKETNFIPTKIKSKDEEVEAKKIKESISFAKNMFNIAKESTENAILAINESKLTPQTLTIEDINALKRLYQNCLSEDDVKIFLDAATWKSGANKGKFDANNLNKYLDMYEERNYLGTDFFKYISSCLSLEDDSYVLDTIHDLFLLKWSDKYGNKQYFDIQNLQFIVTLASLEMDGHPTRKCVKKPFESLNKLMTYNLPMMSKEAFENFGEFGEFDIVEKLERVNFTELGLKSGQITKPIFQRAPEDVLLKFKEFMKGYLKDKNVENIDISPNENIKTIVEITTGSHWDKSKLLYDLYENKPVSESQEYKFISSGNIKRTFKDYRNNTISEVNYKTLKENYQEYEALKSEKIQKFDQQGTLLYEDTINPSEVNNVFEITRTYPNGKIEKICSARKEPTGNTIIEKNMTSFDGTKSIYRYEDDPQGNRIIDYKIIDKNGKKLLNTATTFEVIDDNHFVSSRNDKKFAIEFQRNILKIKNLQTDETKEIELYSFTQGTIDKLIDVLKRIPGDELFKMKELNLKNLFVNEKVSNACYDPTQKSIQSKEKYLDLAVLMHEWGHAKDSLMFEEINEEICNDAKLKEIFEKEKTAFRENFTDAQLSHIGYFTADYHYLGSKAIKEGIAETNMLLDTYPQNNISSIRAHYWQQYFPKTIAYLATLLQ